ncbi:hypothetical protein ACJX0J_035210, partial [Zea mays]
DADLFHNNIRSVYISILATPTLFFTFSVPFWSRFHYLISTQVTNAPKYPMHSTTCILLVRKKTGRGNIQHVTCHQHLLTIGIITLLTTCKQEMTYLCFSKFYSLKNNYFISQELLLKIKRKRNYVRLGQNIKTLIQLYDI